MSGPLSTASYMISSRRIDTEWYYQLGVVGTSKCFTGDDTISYGVKVATDCCTMYILVGSGGAAEAHITWTYMPLGAHNSCGSGPNTEVVLANLSRKHKKQGNLHPSLRSRFFQKMC